MVRRSIGAVIGPAALAGLFLISLTGCPADPYDPETWIEKLDDPGEVEQAVTKLEELKDPVAIKPLAKIWRKHNKWPRVLRVIVGLADQKTEKGGPYWDDAIPVLVEAVEEFDISDRRSIDDAVFAADALGRANSDETVQTLISAATKKMPKLSPGQRVRIAALRALGQFGNNARAVSTLVKVLEADVERQPLQLHAAAANALAETQSPDAIEPLLKALYALSPIYQQVRTALTRIGGPVEDKLIQVFQGKHQAINAYAKEQGFATNCDQGSGPSTSCKAPGNLQFKAASLLGDIRSRKAVKMLADELSKPPLVSFYNPDTEEEGPPNHTAILDALRKIGDPSAAPAVLEYMQKPNIKPVAQPLAIDAYSFLTRDKKGMGWLKAQMLDDSKADQLRKASALAYGRLVTDKSELAPLDKMINTYESKQKEWEVKVRAAKAKKDKKKENEALSWVEDLKLLVMEFRQYKVRAQVGIKCKKDAACYAAFLDQNDDSIVKAMSVPGADKLDKRDKKAYRIAVVERALFELMKMGKDAAPILDKLLEHANSTERIVREGLLLAMVQIAPRPCKKCEQRLAEIIDIQKDQTTLDYLTADTRIVLNYFRSQTGGKE